MGIIKTENYSSPRETLIRILELSSKTAEAAEIIVNYIKAKWRLTAKKVYICCPEEEPAYVAGIEMLAARAYIREAESEFGVRGIAPHGFLPETLNFRIPEEKRLADQIDQELLSLCNRIFICGNRVTPSMGAAIISAIRLEMPLVVFSRSVISEVLRIASRKAANAYFISLEHGGILGMDPIRLGLQESRRIAGEVIR